MTSTIRDEKNRSIEIMRKLLRTFPGSKIDETMCKLIEAPADSRERYGVMGKTAQCLHDDEIAGLIFHLVEAWRRKDRVVCLAFDPVVNICASFVGPEAVEKLESITARSRREAYEKAFDIMRADGAFDCLESVLHREIYFPLEDGTQGIEAILRYCNDNLISVLLPCADKAADGKAHFGEARVHIGSLN